MNEKRKWGGRKRGRMLWEKNMGRRQEWSEGREKKRKMTDVKEERSGITKERK